MDQGPLVNEQIEAGAKLASEFAKYKPLQAVFWLKASDDGEWFLYLVSDQIDDSNFDLAYREVVRLLGRGARTWLDTIQVKVTGINNPVAKDVLDILQSHPGKSAIRLRNRMLGGLSVDEAYVYAVPIAVPS
jgi:hypothetical protein